MTPPSWWFQKPASSLFLCPCLPQPSTGEPENWPQMWLWWYLFWFLPPTVQSPGPSASLTFLSGLVSRISSLVLCPSSTLDCLDFPEGSPGDSHICMDCPLLPVTCILIFFFFFSPMSFIVHLLCAWLWDAVMRQTRPSPSWDLPVSFVPPKREEQCLHPFLHPNA